MKPLCADDFSSTKQNVEKITFALTFVCYSYIIWCDGWCWHNHFTYFLVWIFEQNVLFSFFFFFHFVKFVVFPVCREKHFPFANVMLRISEKQLFLNSVNIYSCIFCFGFFFVHFLYVNIEIRAYFPFNFVYFSIFFFHVFIHSSSRSFEFTFSFWQHFQLCDKMFQHFFCSLET